MERDDIQRALSRLQVGMGFRTPDQAAGRVFTLAAVTEGAVVITSQNGSEVRISRTAFLAAYDYLRANSHDADHRCVIGASNHAEAASPLCQASRRVNGNVRCITYILPILASIGAVGIDGHRLNACWYL